MPKKRRLITIDGPGASGKSSIARLVAQRVGGVAIHTGHLYRAVARHALVLGLNVNLLTQRLEKLVLKLTPDGKLSIDGVVYDELETSEIDALVSSVAAQLQLRGRINSLLKEWVGEHNVRVGPTLILEGRDMAIVFATEATHRFYLDVDVTLRVQRRMKERGGDAEGLRARDLADAVDGRTTNATPDVITIDASSPIEVICAEILKIVGMTST